MDTRAPMKRGQDSSKEGQAMDLPDGKTCGDCAHCRRCCMMFGHISEDEVCDWLPSRFRPVMHNDSLTRACALPART